MKSSDIFDSYYFATSCGRPYQRDDHWLSFFDQIAGRLVSDFQPASVLDAGCAMGFLVEMLRKRGVEAYGVDISDYAIENAAPEIQDSVWVGSVTDPLPRKYDLIVTIEVFEHLSKEVTEKAVENLCQYSDDILFSSTPLDFKEATHFNVQPPEYWAEQFARHGFYRDVDFDATFLTPWAIRFRRRQNLPIHRAVRDYERAFWQVKRENVDLRAQVVDEENQIRQLNVNIKTLLDRLKQWESVWADLERSSGWRFVHRVRVWRMRLAPPGSRRAALLRFGVNGPRILRREGFRAFVAAGWGSLKRAGNGVSGASLEKRNAEAYQIWLKNNTPSKDQLRKQIVKAKSFEYQPLISLITPVYKPPAAVLRATIESVLAQSYSKWELCLVDASPNAPPIRDLVEGFSSGDERIRAQFLEQNLGISGNSNAAIEMAQGEFIAILDHDDLLSPEMLFRIVERLNENRFTDVLYFDEDKLSEDGTLRHDPFFKPDWSPEMLISANYLTHAVYRKDRVDEVGGFSMDYEGAQDWDLAFRITEKTKNIEHIPRVLYQWRQVSGSTSAEFGAKSYVFDHQLECVQAHLQRQGLPQAATSFTSPGILRATWPTQGKKVSIIIPTKDQIEYLRRTIDSLLEQTEYPNYELILVDNGSQKEKTRRYYKKLEADARIRIVNFNEKFNYSRANNIGARHARGEILLFLNNDVEILHSDWLEEMVRWIERPQIGAVGSKLLYPDNTIQHAGVVVGMEGHASHVFWGYQERQSGPFGSVGWYRNFTAVTGACLMIRRDLFETIQGFDEKYILAFSDIEMCIRISRMGYRILYSPFARLRHFEGKSRGDHIPSNDIRQGVEDFKLLVEKGDPFFNPNLSYIERKPTIAAPDEESRVARLLRVAAGSSINEGLRDHA